MSVFIVKTVFLLKLKMLFLFNSKEYLSGGGAVAQSVECTTPGEQVPGSTPAVAARSLLVGSVSV